MAEVARWLGRKRALAALAPRFSVSCMCVYAVYPVVATRCIQGTAALAPRIWVVWLPPLTRLRLAIPHESTTVPFARRVASRRDAAHDNPGCFDRVIVVQDTLIVAAFSDNTASRTCLGNNVPTGDAGAPRIVHEDGVTDSKLIDSKERGWLELTAAGNSAPAGSRAWVAAPCLAGRDQ